MVKMGPKGDLLKYIPFISDFNKEIWARLQGSEKGLFILVLLVFTIVVIGAFSGISTNMMIVILGGFALLAVYIISDKGKEKPEVIKDKKEKNRNDKEVNGNTMVPNVESKPHTVAEGTDKGQVSTVR